MQECANNGPVETNRKMSYNFAMSGNLWNLHYSRVNSLRPRRDRRHFADDIFKCVFLNENEWTSPRISLKFVHKVRINNIPSLVQIMARRRPGDKSLSEPMVVSLPTHICVTRPQWVKGLVSPSANHRVYWGYFILIFLYQYHVNHFTAQRAFPNCVMKS